MSVNMPPTSVTITNLGLGNNGAIHKFFTNTCAEHIDKYVPYREGNLSQYVIEDNDKIVYEQQYAQYQYYGTKKNGEKFNYTKDKHPLADNYWDRRMWSAEQDTVVKEVQNYAERNIWK